MSKYLKVTNNPGGPITKLPLQMQEDISLICGQGAKIPYDFWLKKLKHKNRSNIVMN